MNLKKQLTFIDVFSLAAGAMISSGIFILPGLAFKMAGPSMIVSYFLAGVLALVGIMSVTELATAMPKAGGDYYFVNRSLGPMIGTVAGVLSWFALSLKTSFAIFGIAEVLYLMTDLPVKLLSILVCAAFVGLNIFGVKEAAKLEVGLVVALLLLMGVYVGFGIQHVNVTSFKNFLPEAGLPVTLGASGFVFVSFGGLLNISNVAEEVDNPRRNLPLGLISAVCVVTVMYALLLFVTVGIFPADRLGESLTPIADTAKIFLGQPGYIAITIAAVLAFVTTANAGIMSASRYPMALSRDKLLPESISKITPRFGTPARSVLLTGLVIVLSLFLSLEILVKAASTVVLTSYLLANIAVIVLRQSGIQNYRPSFKAPFYPWIQIASILLFTYFIVKMGAATAEISVGLLVVGFLIYIFYGRKRASGEYAFLHLISRITNRQLESHDLESELREVIHQRDEVVEDKFDKLIAEAKVFDFKGSMSKNDFFKQIATEIAPRIAMNKNDVERLLNEREEDSSTALAPEVAIPHIIVDGEKKFDIFLARVKEGVHFSEEAEAVKAIFVILGSRDERHLHLKSLAAIAQIIQDENFLRRWNGARNENQLRDVLLLSHRLRSI